jgi:LysR family cys regulon transcriptional activator
MLSRRIDVTLKQLRFLREIARHSLNISAAAAALHTSQPAISRQLQLLERELGVDLLVRHRSRIIALTEAAQVILEVADRMLAEADSVKHIAADSRIAAGKLTVATNPLHAHYTLPDKVKEFRKRFKDRELLIVQAESKDIFDIVETNEADIGISNDADDFRPRLVFLPHSTISLSVIVPRGHPLARKPSPNLYDLAAYPIVGHDPRSRHGKHIAEVFQMHHLAPKFIVYARSSEVIRTYVAKGLGIGIISTLALQSIPKNTVHAIDASHLFPSRKAVLILRRDIYLRRALLDFIELLSPQWTPDAVREAVIAQSQTR